MLYFCVFLLIDWRLLQSSYAIYPSPKRESAHIPHQWNQLTLALESEVYEFNQHFFRKNDLSKWHISNGIMPQLLKCVINDTLQWVILVSEGENIVQNSFHYDKEKLKIFPKCMHFCAWWLLFELYCISIIKLRWSGCHLPVFCKLYPVIHQTELFSWTKYFA